MNQDSSEATTPRPFALDSGEGEAWWWMRSLAVIKAGAADTNGLMSVIEVTEPPGEAAPLHVHHREDESFWMLDGNATFTIGDEVIEAHAGDFVYGPRGIPHTYTAGPDGCRVLFILTPGGFEELVIAMSRPAEARTLPPDSDFQPDWEAVGALSAARGTELLG